MSRWREGGWRDEWVEERGRRENGWRRGEGMSGWRDEWVEGGWMEG